MQSRTPSSYLQSLKAQLEPSVRGQLGKLIENFDEEVKKSDSGARKILALFISSVASFQLAKKMAENALLAVLHIEEMLEKSRHEKSVHVRPATFEEEEEETVDSSITASNAVPKLSDQLDDIYAKQRALEEQYTQSMDQIDLLEKEEFKEALLKNMGIEFTEQETAELMGIYKNKPSAENMFKQFTKAITPSLEPTPGAQKKDDVDTKEVAEARADAIKRLQKGLPSESAAQFSGVVDQLQAIGRLKGMAPTAPLHSTLKAGNAIDAVPKKFQPIREKLTKTFEEVQARADATERLQKGITPERVAQSSSLADQIKTIGRLREMAPTAPLRSILTTGNAVDAVPKKFQSLREALTKGFEEARDTLNTQLKGCLDALGRVKDRLSRPSITPTANAAVPEAEAVPEAPPAPPLPGSAPTFKKS